ncbi:hypothetical protein BRO54_0466 [Geobacillus proteiniphilus]|uniref:DUF485 domain-containing protein n=1 Tax=Geobacillus proteiniphilus TaxID=860353 RepID=A0A1Q5T7T6_9BACL|nr:MULTISPECIES: DUF485 domain-containing protein [Geobacillus]MED4974243.1 DUF485 domain-containing protein [Geobacillus thermoleovorans]OKO96287.1 hypothetical protein BRO54_0466 [Geobacillus proteiniphilus]OPX04102.1 hypothetical protein B1A75_05235 [Geobacillus sp. LEMMY01]QCK82267.1 DUF485 domain-containing protein [Geobacillus kaustophilus NBRC 102445]
MAVKKESLAGQAGINYEAIAQSASFRGLVQAKKRFIIPATIFFFVFYFALPVLTSYSKALNAPAVGPVSWAWLFAFAQFVMTWALCILYSKRAAQLDEIVEQVKREAQEGGNA